MIFLGLKDVENLINDTADSSNNRFLSASHNLWRRFHNYDKYRAMALLVVDKVVCIHFATFNKNLYTNSYEIVTMAGHEGKGYARALWEEYVDYAVNVRGMQRLKNSCIASSVTWHIKNGLIFWAIDPTGSLKTDQPLFSSTEAQREARKSFLKNPKLALPRRDVIGDLAASQPTHYSFGVPKTKHMREAIESAGENWLGDWLKKYVE